MIAAITTITIVAIGERTADDNDDSVWNAVILYGCDVAVSAGFFHFE